MPATKPTRLIAVLACSLAACATQSPEVRAPRASGLDVVLVADAPARGQLVVGWHTPEEHRELEQEGPSLAYFRTMMGRLEPRGAIDLARAERLRVVIDGAPSDAVPFVLVDVDDTFWATFLGGGGGLTGAGRPGGGEVHLRGATLPSGPRAERCTGERRRLITLDAPGLSPSTPQPRRFCAWLPSSWEAQPTRRYPVVLLFPGFTSTDTSYLVGRDHLGARMDAFGGEAVLVGVDTSTPLGSTYLEDGPVQGAWATFLAEEALPSIEREVRGLGRRSGRAVIGQSTGGMNALSFGLRRSDLFGAIGSSSPDPPDPGAWLIDAQTGRPHEWLRRWLRLEATLGGAGQFTSWAADWSPPGAGRWPVDPESGRVDAAVLAAWRARTPAGLLRDASFAERARRDLAGRIYVTAGRNDEFGLFPPAEQLARQLEAQGFAPTFAPTEDGHGNERERLERALRFVLEKLDPAG